MLRDRTQSDDLPHINMTPMVDVVLCLLVFFMAATRLYDWDESEFAVSVPEVAEAGPLTAAPDDLILTIVKPGKVAIGTTTYDLPALGPLLEKARDAYVDQGVVIRGDATLELPGPGRRPLGLRRGRHPQRPPPGSSPRRSAGTVQLGLGQDELNATRNGLRINSNAGSRPGERDARDGPPAVAGPSTRSCT